jgi:hypothetical protein
MLPRGRANGTPSSYHGAPPPRSVCVSSLIRSLTTLLVLLAAVACASAPKDQSSNESPAQAVEPPEMNRGSPPPEIRVPISTSGRATVRVDIEVMIDALGQPDMSTFKAVGMVDNIEAIRRWIAGASYRPARLNGRAVPGLFKTKLQAIARRM